jgi:hypothetical protein
MVCMYFSDSRSDLNVLLEKVDKWLSPPDPYSNYTDGDETRQAGTGSWFINSHSFSDWKVKEHSFLWIHGIRVSS